MRIFAISFTVVMLAFVALAIARDTVVLKDGTRIIGDVKKVNGGWRITTADGKSVDVATDKVKTIEVGSAGEKGSPEAAMSNLLSLRRSVENVPDLKQVIDRFNRFIEQNKRTPAADEAKKDLAIWQDRLDRGLVKISNKWVTADERTAMANAAQTIAERAAPMVAAGRLHDAEPVIAQALEADPQCVPALYLRGVVWYQQSQLPPARKAFESVNALINDHAPSHNNMGVILWRQNALIAALAQFDQAITAAPINRTLLDNVAEALNALPEDAKKNVVAQRLYRKFAEQDKQLSEAMATQGMYRWGSSWVDKSEMERLRAAEVESAAKVAAAKAEMDGVQRRVNAIDQELAQADQALRQMEMQSVYRDSDGRVVRIPLPAAYYSIQQDQVRLRADRATEVAKFTAAQQQLKAIQDSQPKPKFTGVAKLVGAEGMPMMMAPPPPPPPSPPPPPATSPASVPSNDSTTTPSTSPSTSPS